MDFILVKGARKTDSKEALINHRTGTARVVAAQASFTLIHQYAPILVSRDGSGVLTMALYTPHTGEGRFKE